ncbi:antitoxin Xre/MbcA/ParS toxin-binding domain-containing protein [Pinisolibacter sp.]|uniref:antitoxin Xre/MbcA/ParS toxin-binding domain-containing protein n=1 Tax=Pinisolibacter sp. TaxID=2172024 RepID=UPI002FDDBC73
MLVRPKEIADVLGGPAVLGRTVRDLGDLDDVVRAGLPFGALDALETRLPPTGGRKASPVRSVVRRRARAAGLDVLTPTEGERAGRVARLVAMATKVFGSPQRATEFLTKAHARLHDRTPLECLVTDIGGREVEEILNAIAYGLPA